MKQVRHGRVIAERLERAATLLLTGSALAAVALAGWGGLVVDLRPLDTMSTTLSRALADGQAVWPALRTTVGGLRWDDLAPLIGTSITVLFWWHTVSLVAEVALLLAASLGWLWYASLRPLWLLLDLLDTAPLATPKRLVVATALASQLFVRSAGAGMAAPQTSQVTTARVVEVAPADESAPTAAGEQAPSPAQTAPAGIVHRVQSGDTLSGMAKQYYGNPGLWPVLWDANRGAVMAVAASGLGTPIRLTSPDELLTGWDAYVPLVASNLERGDRGELIYVVQTGDTLSEIAQRFGIDVDQLAAANKGAQTPDGHVFDDPNLIWAKLRLKVELVQEAAQPADKPVDEPSTPAEQTPPEPTAATTAPVQAALSETSVPTSVPTASSDVSNEQQPPTSVHVARPAPTVLPTMETPARPRAGEPPLDQWPVVLGAGGLSAAVLLGLRARRSRRAPAEPETDTRLDVDAFTLAMPGAVVAARRGGSDDPHGIVLGERVAGALLRHARAAGIETARIVSVKVGRNGCTVAFAAPLEQRPRLEASLRTALHLGRRLTVMRSVEQDVVVRLEGIQRGAVDRVRLEDCPVLLCVGVQPDTRAYLVGWEALGHLLVATQAGTSDAHDHLASLVATLAGQCPPEDIQLYTLAPRDTLLGQLAPLPHQRAMVDAGDGPATDHLLAGLRAELELRQRQTLDPSDPELVLVISELAQLASNEDLVYLLTHASECRVRVLAATADTALEQGPLVEHFQSRLVFALENEQASTRLLGKPWALTLAEPGRLLARLGRRKEVEILGLHLTEDGRRDLLASVGLRDDSRSADTPPADDNATPAGGDAPAEHEHVEGDHADWQPTPQPAGDDLHGADPAVETVSHDASAETASEEAQGAVEQGPAEYAETVVEPRVAHPGTTATNGHAVDEPVLASDALLADCPGRIARLLERARLVIDCDNGLVWSAAGPLRLANSSPVELLFRLAASPLLEQGALDRWPGASADDLLDEVWAPRARDARNRESGQTWLAKNLERLQDEVSRAAGGLEADVLVRNTGTLRVNPHVAVSDVEAFMIAVERTRAARGAERIVAAEEALALRVPDLLPRAYVDRRVIGRKIELYRWLSEPKWERATRRLEPLGRDVMGLLARAYRDAGRHADALVLYAQLLGEDAHDRRTYEGLLIAAAGTGDIAQLQEAWQQICMCLGDEADAEIRGLYQGLIREMEHRPTAPHNGGRSTEVSASR